MKNSVKLNSGQMDNNNEKNLKKKPGKALIIIGSIVLLLAAVIILVPKLLFTDYEGLPTTGPYDVKQVSAILVDENRLETFEDDGSNREVPVYFYYPDVAENTVAGKQEEFPLVIFSHGAFGYYQSNTSTYMELASHGYVVISLDHPYHSFFTKDTAGKTITVNPEFLKQVMYINETGTSEDEIITLTHEWLELRLGDMDFALDSVKQAKTLLSGARKEEAGEAGVYQMKEKKLPDCWFFNEDSAIEQEILVVISMIDTEQIGLMGHSLGGAASVTLGRTREDIGAVINLDGTMLGEEFSYTNGEYEFYEEAYPVPLLAISNEEHYLEGGEVETLYVNIVVLENALDGRYTYFKGSGHMNFTDLPLFSPALASFLGIGEVDAEECITTMNKVVLDYFNCYLKDMGEVTINECY